MRKIICTVLIILLFANVDYAQLITINAFGKTINKEKSLQKEKFFVLPPLIDSTYYHEVEIKKTEFYFALPISYLTITSAFGKRIHPIYHYEKLHAGIDLRASYEAVYAFASGVVSQAAYSSISGNYIIILHGERGILSSVYAHLSYLNVKPGDIINVGQIIGISGSTGARTAPHLHFALIVNNRPIDPFPVLKFIIQYIKTHQSGQ